MPTAITLFDAAYAAGIIDGEGTICTHHNPKNEKNGRKWEQWTLGVQVTNTDMRLIVWLQDRFGGRIYEQRQIPGHKRVFVWKVSPREATALIHAVMPFLLLKHRQAELGLEMLATHGNVGRRGHTAETVATRVRIAHEIKALNRRGVPL